MHGNQPLTSVEAFALALVEASSRLSGSTAGTHDADDVTRVVEELAPAAE